MLDDVRQEVQSSLEPPRSSALRWAKVLEARGLRPLPDEAERIRSCQNGALLDTWLVRAVSAGSVAEVLAD